VQAEVAEIDNSHDIRRLVLKLNPPEMNWITGQYVEIIPETKLILFPFEYTGDAVPAARDDVLEFMIKLYGWKDVDPLFWRTRSRFRR